jgi:hypothetical protein
MREISEPIVRKSQLSLDVLLTEVERVLRDAEADRLHHVRLQALGLVLRIHELVLDQGAPEQQIGGGAMTAAEIRDMLVMQILDDLGADSAIEIADQLLARVADRAVPVGSPS